MTAEAVDYETIFLGDRPAAEAALDALGALEGPGPLEPGWSVLDVTAAFLRRYVVFPTTAAVDAVTLWVAFTHTIEAFDTSPRLNLMSAEKRSGKSRTLEALEPVSYTHLTLPTICSV